MDTKINDKHMILNIEKSPYDFWKLTCPEGYVITDHKDGADIRSYYGSSEVCAPASRSEEELRAEYRCITKEQHEAYEKERQASPENANDD